MIAVIFLCCAGVVASAVLTEVFRIKCERKIHRLKENFKSAASNIKETAQEQGYMEGYVDRALGRSRSIHKL